VRGAPPGAAGRVRRLRVDREALPPPGRDRYAVGADDRPRDARGRAGDDSLPGHARAGADPYRRRPHDPARAARGPVGASRVRGRWQELTFASEALRGNPLGDPHERPVYVWTPPSYDEGERRYPVVYLLQGFTGLAPAWFNVRPWRRTVPQEIDELAPEAIVVLVDAFTAIGGSQFVDSAAIGRYHTYLCDDLVPWIDTQFRAGARALHGHSSGRYGAMVNAMLGPGLFDGFATHAGDALFENCYQHEFTDVAHALRDSYDGSYERFWEDFRSGRQPLAKKTDQTLVNVYAMAAAYSDGELPFDVETAELRDDVWERWLALHPAPMA